MIAHPGVVSPAILLLPLVRISTNIPHCSLPCWTAVQALGGVPQMWEAPGWRLDFLFSDVVCSPSILRARASLWLISAVRPGEGPSACLADQRHSHPLAPGVSGLKRSAESPDAILPCFEVRLHSERGLEVDLSNTNLAKIL